MATNNNRRIRLECCPDCGCKADLFHIPENTPEEQARHPQWRWNNPGKWVIGCGTPRCERNVNYCTYIFPSEEAAVEAWNNLPRAANKGRVCAECDHWHFGPDAPGRCNILARTGWCFHNDPACGSFESKLKRGG